MEKFLLGHVKGKDGVGIQSIEQTTVSEESGGINVITTTLEDGTISEFQIRNGKEGGEGTGNTTVVHDLSAFVSSFESDDTFSDYPFRGKIECEVATENTTCFPHPNEATMSRMSSIKPLTRSFDGGFYIYSKEKPSFDLVFDVTLVIS